MQKIKPFRIKIKPWSRSGRKFWGFTRGKQQKVDSFPAVFCIKINRNENNPGLAGFQSESARWEIHHVTKLVTKRICANPKRERSGDSEVFPAIKTASDEVSHEIKTRDTMKFRSYGAQFVSKINAAPAKAKMSRTSESVSEIELPNSTEFS